MKIHITTGYKKYIKSIKTNNKIIKSKNDVVENKNNLKFMKEFQKRPLLLGGKRTLSG